MIRTLDGLWLLATIIVAGWLIVIDPDGDLIRVFIDHNFWHYLLFILGGPGWFLIAVFLHFKSEDWNI